MGISGRKKMLTGLTVTGLLYFSLAPIRVFADEKDDGTSAKTEAAKPSGTNVNTPAPLTERERLLLDRVEMLEKRVVELEKKAEAPAAASASSSPAPAATVVAAPASAVVGADPVAIGKNDAPVSAQATEKGKPGGTAAPGNPSAKGRALRFRGFYLVDGQRPHEGHALRDFFLHSGDSRGR